MRTSAKHCWNGQDGRQVTSTVHFHLTVGTNTGLTSPQNNIITHKQHVHTLFTNNICGTPVCGLESWIALDLMNYWVHLSTGRHSSIQYSSPHLPVFVRAVTACDDIAADGSCSSVHNRSLDSVLNSVFETLLNSTVCFLDLIQFSVYTLRMVMKIVYGYLNCV